jgi:chromosome segregation ATPase
MAADLSYEQVRNAAVQAMSGLQNALTELRGILRNISAHTDVITSVQVHTTAVEGSLQRIESKLGAVHEILGSMHHVEHEQVDVQTRLRNIEAQLAEVHEHVRALHKAQVPDDKQNA